MLAVPVVMQKSSHDCGAACAAMIMRFWGVRKKAEDIIRELNCSVFDGTDPRSIEAYFRGQCFSVASGSMTLADLKHHVKQGRPVIVSSSDYGGHWVVVKGLKSRQVFFNDPATGEGSIFDSDFDSRWTTKDRFGTEYDHFGIAIWVG